MQNKKKSLLTTTLVVSLLIIIGKGFGFLREAIIAAYYGANAMTDAFFLAQDMPTMIFPAIANSIGFAFTSLYVRELTKDAMNADRKASSMLNATFILGGILSIVGVLLTPLLIPFFAPGFSTTQQELSIELSRVMMASFLLIVIQYVLTALLNSKKIFYWTQIAAMSYNLTVITLMIIGGRKSTMMGLTIMVIIGFIVQDLILLLVTKRNFSYFISEKPFCKTTGELFKLATPILLGNSIIQINNIVDKILGSTLPEGSVSAISYANTLNVLVVNIFVMSLSTVLFPNLTTLAASNDEEQFNGVLINSLKGISLILVPISLITVLDAKEIVSIVFGRGSFDAEAVQNSAIVLACYAPRFVFSGIREVFSRAFFAKQNTKTPMINSTIGVFVNIICSIVLVKLCGIGGIALGTVVSAIVISALLLINFKKKNNIELKEFYKSIIKQIISGACLFITIVVFNIVFKIDNSFVRFFVDTIIGGAVYIGVLLILKADEIIQLARIIGKRIKKTNM